MVRYLTPSESASTILRKEEELQEARVFVDTLFGKGARGRVDFGCSASQLAMNIASTMSSENIVVCRHLEVCMIEPFLGFDVCYWDPIGYRFSYETLFDMITPETSLVLLTHVCSVTGVLFDINYMTMMIKMINSKARVMVDGTYFMPHDILDVEEWDVDYYFVSFQKFFGPHISAVFTKDAGVSSEALCPESLVGLLGIKDHITRNGERDFHRNLLTVFYEETREIERNLVRSFDSMLDRISFFTLATDETFPRIPIFSLDFQDAEYANLFLERLNIIVGYGTFGCAFLEKPVLRLSLLRHNTVHELCLVVEALSELNKSCVSKPTLGDYLFGSSPLYSTHSVELTRDFKDSYQKFPRYNAMRYTQTSLIRLNDMTHDSCFHRIVRYFCKKVGDMSGLAFNYVMAYETRVTLDNDAVTPEAVRHYNKNFVGILCVNRDNLACESYNLYGQETITLTLDEGQMLIFNGKQLSHEVMCVSKGNGGNCVRDMLVLTTVF